MAQFGFAPEDVARLIELVQSRSLSELIVEDEGRRITIRGAGYLRSVAAPVGTALVVHESAEMVDLSVEEQAAAPAVADDSVAVESPMVGVFYRSSRPDSPAFVEVGDHVQVGQTVGLIEAMKVFSEIPAEVAGTVVSVHAENGQLVRTGEALLRIKPD